MRKNSTGNLIAAILLLMQGAVASAQAPVITSDFFTSKPPAATVHGKSCEVAQRYVDIINTKQYGELKTLFATDAVFLTPVGKVLHGRQEIDAFYTSMVGSLAPDIVPVSFISDGAHCVMELVAQTRQEAGKGHHLSAIDHFTVNAEGKITNMIVYLRPHRLPGTPVEPASAKAP
jgi:hypothetical protein